MTHDNLTGRDRRPNRGQVASRIQQLAEAGAKGRSLSPNEIQAVCEALRSQGERTPTRFSAGA